MWAAAPQVHEVTDDMPVELVGVGLPDAGRSYPVIMGDYAAEQARWARTESAVLTSPAMQGKPPSDAKLSASARVGHVKSAMLFSRRAFSLAGFGVMGACAFALGAPRGYTRTGLTTSRCSCRSERERTRARTRARARGGALIRKATPIRE